MNRGFGIILAVPILFFSIAILILVGHVRDEAEDLSEYVLALAIDYSTDAAAAEMLLETPTLNNDYVTSMDAEVGYFQADPEIARTTFEDVLSLNYNMPLSSVTRIDLESNYMPLFCVAAYDGYYMYTPIKDPDSGWRLQGSLKYPYSYEKDDAYYALNLGMDSSYRLKDGNLKKVKLSDVGITKDTVRIRINTLISDQLMYLFQQTTGRNSEFIYIPQDLGTFKEVNPIQGPTVMAFLDRWDVTTPTAISAFSIGGARIESTRVVAGYVINGQKLYSYSDLLPEGIVAVDTFSSTEEAAKAGYYYDYTYMD